MKKSFSLFLFLSIFALATAQAALPEKFALEMPIKADANSEKDLSGVRIPHKIQHKEMWCWASVSAMVMQYFYPFQQVEDCSVVSYVFGGQSNAGCCGPYPAQKCFTTATSNDIMTILYSVKIQSQLANAFSFQELANIIYTNHVPVIAFLANRTQPVGHFIILSGFDLVNGLVVVNDPLQPQTQVIPYQALGAYGPNGALYWKSSIVPVMMKN